nr:unnamed protein product [Spirometra erinaceieuropaei]
MGPLGHMPIHDTGIHRGIDPSGTPCTPIMPGPINIPSPSAPSPTALSPSPPKPPNLSCRTAANKADFCQGRRLEQQPLREMQGVGMAHKPAEILRYADRNKMKNLFPVIEAIDGPLQKGTAPSLSSDGPALLMEKSQIMKSWTAYFRSVLKLSSEISNVAIDRLPLGKTNINLDLPPSLPETICTMQ